MEASISADDVMRAGGFGARDDISSFLPVASDSTDFEASLRDARDYEEPQKDICRPGLGWKEVKEWDLYLFVCFVCLFVLMLLLAFNWLLNFSILTGSYVLFPQIILAYYYYFFLNAFMQGMGPYRNNCSIFAIEIMFV